MARPSHVFRVSEDLREKLMCLRSLFMNEAALHLASCLLPSRVMNRPLAMLTALLWLGACSSPNLDGGDSGTSRSGAAECRWPDALNGADGRTACSPMRALVSCRDPAGYGCGCTTDGAVTCDCSAIGGAGPWTCTSTCAADQYVVACGGVGPGVVPDPPAHCTSAGAVPAGIAYYCCPCQ